MRAIYKKNSLKIKEEFNTFLQNSGGGGCGCGAPDDYVIVSPIFNKINETEKFRFFFTTTLLLSAHRDNLMNSNPLNPHHKSVSDIVSSRPSPLTHYNVTSQDFNGSPIVTPTNFDTSTFP